MLPAKAQRFFLVLPAKSPGKTGDYSFLPEKALVLPAKNFSATRESLLAFLIFFSATREKSVARALTFPFIYLWEGKRPRQKNG